MSRPVPLTLLRCPSCNRGGLIRDDDAVRCSSCGTTRPVRGRTLLFSDATPGDITDSVDRVKHMVKRFPRLYDFLIRLVSPIHIDRGILRGFLRDHVEGRGIVAVNLGSGASDISPEVSNVDLFAYDAVDLACPLENLPFADGTVDVIISIAVLEHVPSPETVVAEFMRVLRPGGRIFLHFPFMQGFHASPWDFSRRTEAGLETLMAGFDRTGLRILGGPTSAFLWVFQEWAAMVLSLGIRPLHLMLVPLLMLLTFPLKFLDIILSRHPAARNIAAGFVYTGMKPPAEA